MIKQSDKLPPHLGLHDSVILFDGVCKLCNTWSNFVIRYDIDKKFKLASVQSEEGQDILRHFGYPTEVYETMLVVEGKLSYEKSEAFFAVVRKLRYPWKILLCFRLLPLKLRDWLYVHIALNRYRWFGKYDYCSLPDPDHESRYLKS